MKKHKATVVCIVCLSLFVLLSAQLPLPFTDYLRLQNPDAWRRGELRTSATASTAMIASLSEPLAIHAGLETLRHGGSAADAALTTSLAQIALSTGAAYSYAGIMTAVYYDASSGKIYTLNAFHNTVKEEMDPLSIPSFGDHSGRTALVPGFMAGVQALHDRFGKLPFEKLFEPAIRIADDGVPFSPIIEAWLREARPFVTRLPESTKIFTKANGEFYKVGETFRQPELADTLKKVASQGSAYMYRGDWARHFVEAVQREGGKMTMDDLAAYQALWTEPAIVDYRNYQIVSPGQPGAGKLTEWSFSLAERANFKELGHYTTSPDSLYRMIQIPRWANKLSFSPIPITTESVAEVWHQIQQDMKTVPPEGKSGANHTSAVLVVDDQGNVASVLHSVIGILWGSTGIFVDGISIPDSASFQQALIRYIGSGARMPDSTLPLIVLKSGKPVLASGAAGYASHQTTLQNLVNILEFGMDVKTSVSTPNTQGPYEGTSLTGPPQHQFELETIAEGAFSSAVLDGVRARGQGIKIVPASDPWQMGYWAGIQIDPQTHRLKGAVTSRLPGMVEGYQLP